MSRLESKKIRRFLAVLLTFILIMPSVKANAATKTYSDIKGHKYATALNYAVKNGLITSSTKKIKPDDAISRGAVRYAVNELLGATEQYADMSSIKNMKKGQAYY